MWCGVWIGVEGLHLVPKKCLEMEQSKNIILTTQDDGPLSSVINKNNQYIKKMQCLWLITITTTKQCGRTSHSKKFPVAWYCKLRNGYTPFLQEHYWYYLASYFMLQVYQVLFFGQKKGNPALFRLNKLRV